MVSSPLDSFKALIYLRLLLLFVDVLYFVYYNPSSLESTVRSLNDCKNLCSVGCTIRRARGYHSYKNE